MLITLRGVLKCLINNNNNKTRSHYTGLGEIALAPSPVAHHLQSRSHYLQNTSFKKTGLSLGVAVLPSCAKNTPIKFFISSTRWCSQDFSQVAPSVLQRRKFGTVFRTTWPTFLCHWTISNNNLKHICLIRPTVTGSPPVRACDSVSS